MNVIYCIFLVNLWILIVCLSSRDVSAQVIRNVSFDVTVENTIKVTYLLSVPKFSQQYNVKLFISQDGGNNYFSPKALLGDVGTVSGYGSKKIIWDVFSDFDAFECEKCVVKVTADEIVTFKDRLTTVFLGSDESKSVLNGVMFQLGVSDLSFENESFKNSVDNGVLSPSIGFDIGLKYVTTPYITEVSISYQAYNFNEVSVLDTIQYLALNISESVFLFPLLKKVVPYAGIGYQISELYIGEWFKDPVSKLGTSAPFWRGGAQANIGKWRLGGDFKQSIGSGIKKWRQLNFYFGYGGPLPDLK